MGTAWVQHDATSFAQAIAGELPTGAAWPRDPDDDLMKWVNGCAQIWGDVSGRAAALLLTETDPRFTVAMLPDWERAFGLPDPCSIETLTLANRHAALLAKMTTEGGQSGAFFIKVAAALGYDIAIREYSPLMAGVSRCGDTRADGRMTISKAHCGDNRPAGTLAVARFRCGTSRCGTDRLSKVGGSPQGRGGSQAGVDAIQKGIVTGTGFYRWQIAHPDIRFWWKVTPKARRLTWFRMGQGQCGVDPMVRIGFATDLECVFRRWKPAHTDIVFDYAALA